MDRRAKMRFLLQAHETLNMLEELEERLEEEESSRARRARRRAAMYLLQMEGAGSPIHAHLNPHCASPCCVHQSVDTLMRILPSKYTQGWSHEVHVLVTLYWLAHGLSYSVVSRAFYVPKSMVCRLVHTGVRKIAALRHEVICQPTAGALDEVGQAFVRLANSPVFARCVGSINGCHVCIKTPPGPGGQDYLNRKLFPSIQLQAVYDGKGVFISTFVGYPGSVHNTRVLKNSRLYTAALYPPPGYFIVGDGGYPCIEQPVATITPYGEPVQGRGQSRFNHHHSKARSIIEWAFGMLKTRWRSLFFKALEVNHTFVPLVKVLHNICLTSGDGCRGHWCGSTSSSEGGNDADMASGTNW